jgi:hypothetical protein
MTKSVLFGAAALALTVTAVLAQQLTPFQSQVLGGIKKLLTEYAQQQHGNCTTPRVCDIGRVEVLDEVLEHWENTPAYGKYAAEIMDWHAKRSMAIGKMANDYVVRHGRLDPGFDNELLRRSEADPAFHPPKEYSCRHMFGTPHMFGAAGQDLCK